MRRTVAAALLISSSVLTAGCGVLADAADGLEPLKTFEAPGFAVDMPCTPDKRTDQAPVPGGRTMALDTWMCEGSRSAYGVSTAALPQGLPYHLDGAAQGAATAVHGTVESTEKVTYAGVPGRDIRISSQLDGKPATGFYRVLLRKRTLYQVIAVVAGDETTPPDRYQDMLESLTFR